jgi:cellulose synthase/poly-beta-1,6-N-acetylglucosamine synthase-like glycosyltransferase
MPALILALYFLTLGALAGLGFHRIHLLLLLRKHRSGPPPGLSRARGTRAGGGHTDPAPGSTHLPFVTVQLPIYNEAAVAPRLIEAVCRLDWPRDRIEIQVLDDSTDETHALVEAGAARLRAEGNEIRVLHRDRRDGYKAGALASGLAAARGDLIAVFDADFVPGPGFLRETVPAFADPSLGMVQARWGHLNREHSWLTRVQALFLDGHFLIEHAARHASGRFFNFNGTAGVWRRDCIEEAGGWQHDTLTEDLDLSYRAQLAGWRFAFLPATVAPAELPIEISAFRGQQHRWAKGSIQTARKLLPRILAAPLPLRVRAEAFLHLTANAGYLVLLAFSLLLVPAMLVRPPMTRPLAALLDVALYSLSTLAFWAFYTAAERQAGGDGRRALATMPALMLVGVGLSWNNARAVIEGLLSSGGAFERTPKHGVEDGRPLPAVHGDGAGHRAWPWAQALLAGYFAAGLGLALREGRWPFLPILALFGAGHATMAFCEWRETRRARRSPPRHAARSPRPATTSA